MTEDRIALKQLLDKASDAELLTWRSTARFLQLRFDLKEITDLYRP